MVLMRWDNDRSVAEELKRVETTSETGGDVGGGGM